MKIFAKSDQNQWSEHEKWPEKWSNRERRSKRRHLEKWPAKWSKHKRRFSFKYLSCILPAWSKVNFWVSRVRSKPGVKSIRFFLSSDSVQHSKFSKESCWLFAITRKSDRQSDQNVSDGANDGKRRKVGSCSLDGLEMISLHQPPVWHLLPNRWDFQILVEHQRTDFSQRSTLANCDFTN